MPPSVSKEIFSESPELPPSDAEQIPRELEQGENTVGVQDDDDPLRPLHPTPGTNLGIETEGGDDDSSSDEDGDGSSDSGDEKSQKFENLMESSLVLNYMLSRHGSPTCEVSMESISEDVGVERDIIVNTLGEFTLADRDLDDLVRAGSPQKEVDRIRQLASQAEITIPSEGDQEEGLPRLPISDVLELTLEDPWHQMGPLKEQTFHISRRIQSLWGWVEELLSCRHWLSHFSGALEKRDELRDDLIKFGLEQLSTSEISRDALKIQCFEGLNLACVIIEVFMEKIAKESEKGHTGESEEDEESEVNEESGGGEEGRDTASSQSQSSRFGGETKPKRNKFITPRAHGDVGAGSP